MLCAYVDVCRISRSYCGATAHQSIARAATYIRYESVARASLDIHCCITHGMLIPEFQPRNRSLNRAMPKPCIVQHVQTIGQRNVGAGKTWCRCSAKQTTVSTFTCQEQLLPAAAMLITPPPKSDHKTSRFATLVHCYPYGLETRCHSFTR